MYILFKSCLLWQKKSRYGGDWGTRELVIVYVSYQYKIGFVFLENFKPI